MSLFDEHLAILVTGISASGKSTVGELLARRFDRGVHVRGDGFRRMVRSGRAEMTADPPEEALRQLRLRYRIAAGVADEYFDNGFSVVIQDIVLGPALAEFVRDVRSRPLLVVGLRPTVEVVEQRERDRSKVAYGEGRMSAAELDEMLTTETPRIGLWLDSSALSPEETVDEIARGAERARVV